MKGESFFALVAGAAIGAALGVLFAPAKGEETRKKMADAAQDGYDKAKDKATELYGEAKDKTREAYIKTRIQLRDAKEQLDALKEMLSKEGANLKEEARVKALDQLEKLEKALAKDPDIDEQ